MSSLEAKTADQTKLLGLNYTYYNNSNVQTQQITGSGLVANQSYYGLRRGEPAGERGGDGRSMVVRLRLRPAGQRLGDDGDGGGDQPVHAARRKLVQCFRVDTQNGWQGGGDVES